MRDKSSALEASERSIRESISRVLDCVSAGRGRCYLRRGNPRQEPSAFGHGVSSCMSVKVNYSSRVGMTQIIVVDLDGTLSDPVRKLEC